MKIVKTIALLLCLVFIFSACGKYDIECASYNKNTELGDGSKTLFVEIVDEDKAVLFTIHTDAENVGEALSEHKLISGENTQYGMYIKFANGIRADYNLDGAYWAFYKNGEYLNSAIDTTEFEDREHYELIYTKG